MALSLPLILAEVDQVKSQKQKKEVLLKYNNSALREILKYAFHPDIKFLLPPGDPPHKDFMGDTTPNPTYLYGLIRKLYLFVEGGNPNLTQVRREYLFIELLESVSKTEAELLMQIKDKKIQCRGLTYKLIKEVFPDLIP